MKKSKKNHKNEKINLKKSETQKISEKSTKKNQKSENRAAQNELFVLRPRFSKKEGRAGGIYFPFLFIEFFIKIL